MTFKEIKGDLFDFCEGRVPVHAISSDSVAAGGIAPLIFDKYNLSRSKIRAMNIPAGGCVYEGGVMNMITKTNVYDRPTYEDFYKSLVALKKECYKNKIKYLVMPRIGCGIDGLDWMKVRGYILEVFRPTDFDILVCVL